MSELKPCPFCGHDAILHEIDWCEPPEHAVICSNVDCLIGTGSKGTAEKAATLWNRRASALPAVGDDELEVWERVLPHPQAGTSDLRYLHCLAISRAHAAFPTAENVERVARAICDCDPDAETAVTGWTMLPDRTGRRTMQEPTPIKAWQRFVAKARLAIAAMSAATSADVEKIGRAAIKAADEFGLIGNADSYEQWRKEQAVAVGSAVVALSAAPSGDGRDGGKERPELDALLAEARDRVSNMSPEELEEMLRLQRESWARQAKD